MLFHCDINSQILILICLKPLLLPNENPFVHYVCIEVCTYSHVGWAIKNSDYLLTHCITPPHVDGSRIP